LVTCQIAGKVCGNVTSWICLNKALWTNKYLFLFLTILFSSDLSCAFCCVVLCHISSTIVGDILFDGIGEISDYSGIIGLIAKSSNIYL
jgi:hypothetical protein